MQVQCKVILRLLYVYFKGNIRVIDSQKLLLNYFILGSDCKLTEINGGHNCEVTTLVIHKFVHGLFCGFALAKNTLRKKRGVARLIMARLPHYFRGEC